MSSFDRRTFRQRSFKKVVRKLAHGEEKMEKKDAEIEQLERQREELSKLIANIPSEKEMKLDIMDLTHKYNEVKDATQTVIGAVAHIKGVTFKSLHEEFEVPFN